jgi:hypothetical protein
MVLLAWAQVDDVTRTLAACDSPFGGPLANAPPKARPPGATEAGPAQVQEGQVGNQRPKAKSRQELESLCDWRLQVEHRRAVRAVPA